MHSAIKKLMDYMSGDKHAMGYLGLAMQTVFSDIAEDNGLNDLSDLEEFFGFDGFSMIYPVMLEFFFTNVYGQDGNWNIIDSFLALPKNGLSKGERAYLTALRPSIMSIYEVTAIEPEKSLTVHDMIRGGKPIKVKEASLTRYVSQWDCLGLRVLDISTHQEFAGGCLQLERNIAEDLALSLESMRDMTVTTLPMHEPTIPKEKIAHYAEVMWAAEIAMAWIEWVANSQTRKPPQLYNSEGHAISPVTISFPATKDHDDIAAFFDKNREFDQEKPNEWVWLKKQKGGKSKKTSYTVRGNIILQKNCLELFVNSRERANILEDIVSKKLSNALGKPEWSYVNAPSASAEAFLSSFTDRNNNDDGLLSQEDVQTLVFEMKDDHYNQWLSSRIPALEDKTPRMARRSKKGQAQLISLLKDIENHEIRQAKANGIKPYDMTWIWKELDLDRKLA